MYSHDLPAISYRILAYFKNHAHSSVSDAASAMPDIKSIDLRIEELCPTYLSCDCKKQTDEGFTTLDYLDAYCITPFGEKVLQDFEVAQNEHRKELWLVNAKIPILVSFITTLGLHLLLWLLPLTLELFSSFQP